MTQLRTTESKKLSHAYLGDCNGRLVKGVFCDPLRLGRLYSTRTTADKNIG